MHVPLEKTLDVDLVERQLAELWKKTSGASAATDEFAVLRSRVANLLVYVPSESLLDEVEGIVFELTAIHPSRVLLLLGEKQAANQDIGMSVETFCHTEKRTGEQRLCCEQITLTASGSFIEELPSAALPLAVPDLTTFLWWRDVLEPRATAKVFRALLQASDRLIIDSADFADPNSDLLELANLFNDENHGQRGISDLNWARLTAWRALLAGFYDVADYQPPLQHVEQLRIDYLAPEHAPDAIAPQALLIAGWLASRLNWKLIPESPSENSEREIKLQLNRVEHAAGKPGRLVRVELQTAEDSFAVSRSEDNLHLATEARMGNDLKRGRVLPVRNRSAARLLGGEMEILCNDQVYQEALAVAATLRER